MIGYILLLVAQTRPTIRSRYSIIGRVIAWGNGDQPTDILRPDRGRKSSPAA
jgi:hypothetical protein